MSSKRDQLVWLTKPRTEKVCEELRLLCLNEKLCTDLDCCINQAKSSNLECGCHGSHDWEGNKYYEHHITCPFWTVP